MDPKTLVTLSEALRCEYKARAIYRATLDRFGAVHPFVHLAEAGEREIDAVRQLYQRNRIEPPSDRWIGELELPQTLEQARREAIEAEIETADTCERLLDEVDDPVCRLVLSRLEEASRYQRLPLLRRYLGWQKA
jgi:rubrerythrin